MSEHEKFEAWFSDYTKFMSPEYISSIDDDCREAWQAAKAESAAELAALRAELESKRQQYEAACVSMAEMFEAATGSKDGPKVGILEDLTALRDQIEACAIYLKPGETPRERMDRDAGDTTALMKLFEAEKRTTETLRRELEGARKDADNYWNDDDRERNYSSISEFLNDKICNGTPIEVGSTFTLLRAVSLPKITIRVTSVDEEECEADYEIVGAAIDAAMKEQK